MVFDHFGLVLHGRGCWLPRFIGHCHKYNRLTLLGNVVPVATKVLLTLRRHQYRRSVTENKTNVKTVRHVVGHGTRTLRT